MVSDERPRFHLAIPVHDLDAAREFYGEVMGCTEGRSAPTWVDFSLYGHQLVAHLDSTASEHVAVRNEVDGSSVPVPHFGLVLEIEAFHALAQRFADADVAFEIAPGVRFEGLPGEQWTMFVFDPSGNAVECKAFADIEQLFATD